MLSGWSVNEVSGKRVEVFTASPQPPRFALLFLHPLGCEMPSTNVAYTAAFAKLGFAVAAPFGARSWWADKVCSEFDDTLTALQHLIQNVVPWMKSQWRCPVGVAGISMGGQAAIRLGFQHPDLFPAVAGVASAIEHHQRHGQGDTLDEMYPTKEACRQDGAILHVNPHHYPRHIWFACDPEDVEFIRGNDRLHEKLNSLGIAHTADLETHVDGHGWGYFNAMAMPMCEYLKTALEKESRRLI